ncbi:MAG: leucine-rich repeat domain-containing protein [Gammaproteobacteria bacterium]|nr:leucine-rich repeat domain-containing protein [Gammaproteobacteria bacterium]
MRIFVLLPLLIVLGGCSKEPVVEVNPVEEKQQEVKPVEEVPVNPNLKYEIKDDEVTITDFNTRASGELIIPASIEGKLVTSIGRKAFSDCYNLTSITIPDSVTSIGELAFAHSRMTSITIGNGVTSIGKRAFGYAGMTSITIGNSVTSIGEWAFSDCPNLTSLTIPGSVTSIGGFAFNDCKSLTSITIGNGVTSIGRYAFQYCYKLTSITIPDSVTSIALKAFYNCRNLTAVTFLGDAPEEKLRDVVFFGTSPTIYRKPEAKGWGDTFAGRPVKLISEKP